jgi:hypothetical protein
MDLAPKDEQVIIQPLSWLQGETFAEDGRPSAIVRKNGYGHQPKSQGYP